MTTNQLLYISQTAADITGVPFAQSLSSNHWITGALLMCFLLTAYIFSRNKYYLIQQFRNLFFTRERNSIFNQQTASDVHHRFLLILQTCILTGILFLSYNISHRTISPQPNSIPIYLSIYTAILLFYYFLKWGIYHFINWIFFDKTKGKLWSQSYSFIIAMLGFAFLPFTLIAIYCHLPKQIIAFYSLLIFVLINFLIIYKSFSIFFNRLHGLFYLIVYFCTLEILPFLILWKGSTFINSILTLKI